MNIAIYVARFRQLNRYNGAMSLRIGQEINIPGGF